MSEHEHLHEDDDAAALLVLGSRTIAEAMRTESYTAVRAFVLAELAGIETLDGEPVTPEARTALGGSLSRVFWNVAPLPSHGFRPQPLPAPERNGPCPCGSGRKYKQCCALMERMAPQVSESEVWSILAHDMAPEDAIGLLDAGGLPVQAIAPLVEVVHEAGDTVRAMALLQRALDGAARLGPAWDGPLALEVSLARDLHGPAGAAEAIEARAGRIPRGSGGTAWLLMVPTFLEMEDVPAARAALEKAMAAGLDHPGLGGAEVLVLLAEDDLEGAGKRARHWAARLRKREDADELDEEIDFLDEVAADPEAARVASQAAIEGEEPTLGDELIQLIEEGCERPVRPYPLGKPGPHGLVFDRQPEGVAAAEAAWAEVWPAPSSQELLPPELPPEVYVDAEGWLRVLHQHPDAFDSLPIIGDLVQFAAGVRSVDLATTETVFRPLLDRARAIVDASLAPCSEPTVAWSFPANRPALRLLVLAGMDHYQEAQYREAAELLDLTVRLDPEDRHGHRRFLVESLLRSGQDAAVVALRDAPAGIDTPADVTFGVPLALWRLGRRDEAAHALAEAVRERLDIGRALAEAKVRRPALVPSTFSPGGAAEVWDYRERMRSLWLEEPELIEILRGALPRTFDEPTPRRRRKAR